MPRNSRPWPLAAGPVLALLARCACAQADAADAPAPPAEPAATAAQAAAWDAALGLLGAVRPQYPGSPRRVLKTTPAFYLRYGRYTVSNASSLAPRRSEDAVRGLGLELLESDRLRASLSLRYDTGRSEHSSPAYEGLGKIPHTVRARLALSWQLAGPWRLGASWNPDALGRGNGSLGDFSLAWDHRLQPHTSISVAAAMSFGDRRYMQAYYGINPQQSQRSVYPVYDAQAGLRDISLGASVRHDLGREWVVLAGASVNQLRGSAAASPITRQTRGSGINAGVARMF